MPPRVLFVITSDPRESHRPAEAIRIAAGVSAWQKTDMRIYLAGAALLLLGGAPGSVVDENDLSRYLPLLCEGERAVFVQEESPLIEKIRDTTYPWRAISKRALAEMAAQSCWLLHF